MPKIKPEIFKPSNAPPHANSKDAQQKQGSPSKNHEPFYNIFFNEKGILKVKSKLIISKDVG